MFKSLIRPGLIRLFNKNIINHNQRFFHEDFNNPDDIRKKLAPLKKFQVYRDSEAQIILDVEEERQVLEKQQLEQAEMPKQPSIDLDITLERGLTGVIEIEELVKILHKDNGIDICVCKMPDDLKYVNHICIVTGRSYRHMLGMAEYVRRIFKLKRHKGDILPKIEGENSKDWIAMDLGNIALHIFSPGARHAYDIEQLWALGSQYDEASNQKDEGLAMLEKYSIYLDDLKPKKG